ncbi:DUF1868 domain-containing protein [Serratia entomophila]|uniref:DUF1868 domain-containing protein n=1 Tax=Serratia entomophila TaxID=42906 RepID=UPI002178ED9E|nr:DUF1868 domain-containing protein [Serratia entomophila]CAI1057667.1 Uncharacterized protein conserved in bacteria [Serratia entomophila]CAI1789991.1 Uncharacterized protein conserved in bacteria [Serratia entomophila]CAI1830445.1 Uncharacterized protein conserved in bacteria [Serratia entomophila]CAI1843875.1 Uncharacterized protein conserved in bacteria [Serratia entomophila]CAI1913829.1 Uncharacterized protein conserved in bacteria [Serratia entomophila]
MKQKTLPDGVTSGKFNHNGQAQLFAGNTVLSHISNTLFFRHLNKLYFLFSESQMNGRLYTLLPPESYHITLFDGVCRKSDGTWYWPASYNQGSSLDECTAYCREQLITSGIISPKKTFIVTGIKYSRNTIALITEPTKSCEAGIKAFRNQLSDVLEIRRDNHEQYVFHISFAYFLRFPDKSECQYIRNIMLSFINGLTKKERLLDLGDAEFCYFRDMTAFKSIWFF